MYIISIKKSRFIKEKFFQTSFRGEGDEKADRREFDKQKTPAELHYLASIFNWDDDKDVLEWIVNNPLCDKGTAFLIFWRSQPDFYTRFENEDEAEYDRETFRLVRNVVLNFQNGFYKSARIKFNPNSDEFDVSYVDPKAKCVIPDEMKKRIIGLPVISIEDTTNFLGLIAKAMWRELKRRARRVRKKVVG